MLKINNKQIRAPPAAAVLCVGWGVRKRRETHLGAENGGHCILGKVVLRQQTLILFLRNVQKRFRDNRVSTGPDPLRTPLGAAFLAPPPSHLRESTLVWEAPSREEDGNTGFELQRCRCPGFSGRPLAGSLLSGPWLSHPRVIWEVNDTKDMSACCKHKQEAISLWESGHRGRKASERALSTEHRAPSTEHRAPSTEHQAPHCLC